MRKSITYIVVAILSVSTLPNHTNAATLLPGNDSGFIIVKPTADNLIDIFAAGDSAGAISVTGMNLRAKLGDGDGGDANPTFTDFSFGDATTADLQLLYPDADIADDHDERFQPSVFWFPDAINGGLAADFPKEGISGALGILNDGSVFDGGVIWWESGKTTDLPLENPTDPTSTTRVAQFTIDASGFTSTEASPASFPLMLAGNTGVVLDSDWIVTTGDLSAPATVQNTMLIVAPQGDADTDGTVGLFDLTILADNFALPGEQTWESGDFDGDGVVGLFDLTFLSDNFATSVVPAGAPATAPPAISVVPEPSSAIIVMAMTMLATNRVRRRGLSS